jgi:hypothetical protein
LIIHFSVLALNDFVDKFDGERIWENWGMDNDEGSIRLENPRVLGSIPSPAPHTKKASQQCEAFLLWAQGQHLAGFCRPNPLDLASPAQPFRLRITATK